MTEAERLELRRATAEKIGWTEVHLFANVVMGVPPTAPDPDADRVWDLGREVWLYVVPPYEASMDACLRDLVPWAQEKGYFVEISEIVNIGKGWSVIFWHLTVGNAFRGVSVISIAEAVCLAVLKLEG